VVPEDSGSLDTHPPHLIAFLDRDLRWAAGNWQYRLLLRHRDLGRLGRFQMLQALLHYALSPLWLAMLPLAALNAASG
jgi:membrane glycosyltransferase